MDRIIPVAGGDPHEPQLTTLRSRIQQCLDAGLEVMVDDHSYAAYRSSRTRWANAVAWCDDFEKLFLPYKNNNLFVPEIGTNEPNGYLVKGNSRGFQEKCRMTLRSRGWNNPIAMQGTADYSSAQNWVGRGDDQFFVDVASWDPGGKRKLRAGAHQYFNAGDAGTGSVAGDGNSSNFVSNPMNNITPFLKFLRANDIDGYLGETQVYDIAETPAFITTLTNYVAPYRRNLKGIQLYAMTNFFQGSQPLAIIDNSGNIKSYPLTGLISGYNAANMTVPEATIDPAFVKTPNSVPGTLVPYGLSTTTATDGVGFTSTFTNQTTGALSGAESSDPKTVFDINDAGTGISTTYSGFVGLDNVTLAKMMGNQEVTSTVPVTVGGTLVDTFVTPQVARTGTPFNGKLLYRKRGNSAFSGPNTSSTGEAVTVIGDDVSATFTTPGTSNLTISEVNAYASNSPHATVLPINVIANNADRPVQTYLAGGTNNPYYFAGTFAAGLVLTPGIYVCSVYQSSSALQYVQVQLGGAYIDPYANSGAAAWQIKTYVFQVGSSGTYNLNYRDSRNNVAFPLNADYTWTLTKITHAGLPTRVAYAQAGADGLTQVGGAITVDGFVAGMLVSTADIVPTGIAEQQALTAKYFYTGSAEVAGNAIFKPINGGTFFGAGLLLDFPYV